MILFWEGMALGDWNTQFGAVQFGRDQGWEMGSAQGFFSSLILLVGPFCVFLLLSGCRFPKSLRQPTGHKFHLKILK